MPLMRGRLDLFELSERSLMISPLGSGLISLRKLAGPNVVVTGIAFAAFAFLLPA